MRHIEKKLGQRIGRQRKLAGFTQAQLAEKAGVQPLTISRLETGSRAPSFGLLVTIAKALGLDLDELVKLRQDATRKDRALEKLAWFTSRLTPDEIELVIDVGAAVLKHARGEKKD